MAMNGLVGTLLLGLAVMRTAVAGAAPAAIPDGPAVASHIHFEFAIYYPVHPAVEPKAVLRGGLSAVGMPRLAEQADDDAAAPEVSARWVPHAGRDYAPPSAGMIKLFGRGLTPEQQAALTKADEAFVMDFAHPGKDRMAALRNAQLLAEQVARDTHGLIWDEETREVFTPDKWHERRVLGWEGGVPDISRHMVMHFYRGDGDDYRTVTLGMAKFGEPDIVVEDMVVSQARSVGNLVNALSQALVEGSSTDARGQLTLHLQQSRNPSVAKAQGEGLKANAKHAAQLLLVQGVRQDGDPKNRLVRIAFDRYDGPDEHARQSALVDGLFGSEDRISHVRHDEKLLAARDAARAKLPALRDTFDRGLAPGEYIDVKAPFATDHGGREWMWVEVRSWKGDRIEGTLQNEPDDVKRLRSGQDVVVSQADLFDYIFHRADGKVEGNTTGAIIEEMEREGH
jgi:uncharacterized protein YegJ (DUF2314 family)